MSKPFVIDHSTNNDLLFDPLVDGERKGRGYDPSFIDPEIKREMKRLPSEIKIVPRSEWSARIKERKEKKQGLRYLKQTMNNGNPHLSLDQNGQGYCWAYSQVAGIMYARATQNLPYVRLSPHAVACVIKNFRDEGGWCGLSARFCRGEDPNHPGKSGCPPEASWPQKSMRREHNTPATWNEAAKYKVTDYYADITVPVYDQNMMDEQIFSCFFANVPVILDYNEWGHSILGIDVDEIEPGVFVPLIDNSWTPSWGDNGTGFINRRWNVDGATAVIVA